MECVWGEVRFIQGRVRVEGFELEGDNKETSCRVSRGIWRDAEQTKGRGHACQKPPDWRVVPGFVSFHHQDAIPLPVLSDDASGS